ncbi:hypothetical protein FEM48_Zijuj05G0102600 [Ziziphus jujuba var. spinosa]|uniref:non-specific serine/threonine protein kinase n=1 Tax=Ziziphus jujuba var. spinosa TaxID=714518 RepID=A0A978VED5_ZIZJJ|nr:hypothetical protein FEM48_Zijuj05G0102600 [Ziziphus jujuba var. spinosa]
MLLPSILKQLITILFILSAILSSISHCRSSSSSEEEEGSYIDCGRTYECGDLKNISYPLWGADFRPLSCGREGFEVECRNNKQPVIRINGQEFRILNISKTGNGVKIARNDLLESDGLCNENTVAITLNYSLFDYASTVRNLTLIYSCQQGSTLVGSLKNFTCDANGQTVYYTTEERYLSKPEAPIIQRNCNLVQVPVLRASIDENPDPIGRKEVEQVVRQGFEVDYSQQLTFMCNQCERSGGRCGSNATDGFLCYCRNNKSHDMVCHPAEDRTNWKIGVVLGAICAAIGILLTCVIICVTRNVKLPRKFFSQMTKSDKDIEGRMDTSLTSAVVFTSVVTLQTFHTLSREMADLNSDRSMIRVSKTVYYANDSSPRILQGCRGKITVTIFWTALNSSGSGMDKVQEALNLEYDRCRIQVLRGDL